MIIIQQHIAEALITLALTKFLPRFNQELEFLSFHTETNHCINVTCNEYFWHVMYEFNINITP